MAELALNKEFKIYNENGTEFHNLVLRKSTVESIVMSLGDKITGDVYYINNELDVTMHEYIMFNGVKYVLINPPTVVREGTVKDAGDDKGLTKYSFVFYHPMCLLGNLPFSDVAVTADETSYLSDSKVFSWIGYPADFMAKLNKNLYGTEWIVEMSSRFPADKLDKMSDVLQFDKVTIADALKKFYDTWEVPFVVDKVKPIEASYAIGKRFKVVLGLPSNEIYATPEDEQEGIPFVFKMEQGVGLKNNSRTPRNNKIITRISGFGEERNIPYGYPQILWYGESGLKFTYGDHAGVYENVTIGGHTFAKIISYPIYKGILGGAYVELIKHPFTRKALQPSVYRQTLFNKISFLNSDGTPNTSYDPDITLVDYYDAVYSEQYPYVNTINPVSPSYESHEFEDEYPQLGEEHIVAVIPLDKNLNPTENWDDSIDNDGNYNQSYFKLTLPRLSFDLYACAAITEEMEINMRSGDCLGCTFTVQVNWDAYKSSFYDVDGNFVPNGAQRDLSNFPKSNLGSIDVIVKKDLETFGTIMPNTYQHPNGETSVGAGDGDQFVLLGISMPDTYITSAEAKLDDKMKSYMLENNVYYFDYPLKFSELFLANHKNIVEQIHPNTIIRFEYAGEELSLYVKQLTIRYGNEMLPQYDITLTDDVDVVLNKLGEVADDINRLSSIISILRQEYGRNVWQELSKKLSKTQDDTAQGFLRLLKGHQVGSNFVSGLVGEGGVFRKESDGTTYLEADKMYIRVKAYFDNVVVREYQHSTGNRIVSDAGANVCRVAWFDENNNELEQAAANLERTAYFRCFFRASDGEDEIRNDFVVGDLVYCHESNVANDNPERPALNQKHYWRLCIGRNTEGVLTENGEAWIDISNRAVESILSDSRTVGNGEFNDGTEFEAISYSGYQSGSSVPEAQDDIIQLGNVNDGTRQGAIIEFVSGADAPSYQIYQNINSFSLTDKSQITIGYDSSTGHAKMNVFGDAYIGARNGSTFIRFEQQNSATHQPKLTIKAEIEAQSTIAGQSIDDYIANNDTLNSLIDGLQDQIDGSIDTWFFDYMPVSSIDSKVPLINIPVSGRTVPCKPYYDWYTLDGGGTAQETDTERIKHLGDIFYDNKTGYAFRFSRNESTQAFEWTVIEDSAVITALQNAARAQDTADNKRRVFTSQPTPPYEVGDLWVNASGRYRSHIAPYPYIELNNDILRCTTAKAAGAAFSINDWINASDYTNDDALHGYIAQILNKESYEDGDADVAAAAERAIRGALGGGTIVDGGLLLTSLIAMREKNLDDSYTTWAGISGMMDSADRGGGLAAWFGGAMADMEDMTPQQQAAWNALTPQQKAASADWAKIALRFDGSGYLASKSIRWTADGKLYLSNIQSESGGSVDEYFFDAFGIGVDGVTRYINPNFTFSDIDIVRRSGNAYQITDSSVLSFGELKSRLVTSNWFSNFFEIHCRYQGVDTVVAPNASIPSGATMISIKAKYGLWSDSYISALGQNASGGGGGGDIDMEVVWGALENPTDEQINATHLECITENYLPLSGGVLTGSITAKASNNYFGYTDAGGSVSNTLLTVYGTVKADGGSARRFISFDKDGITFGYQSATSVLTRVATGTDAGRLAVNAEPLAYKAEIPTVYAWALAATKPSYTLDEVSDGATRKLSNYLPLTGGSLSGNLTVMPFQSMMSTVISGNSITFNPLTGNSAVLQCIEGRLHVGNNQLAYSSEVPSPITNYMTTDTYQNITESKSWISSEAVTSDNFSVTIGYGGITFGATRNGLSSAPVGISATLSLTGDGDLAIDDSALATKEWVAAQGYITIAAVTSVCGYTGAVTASQIATALTSAGNSLTDTLNTAGATNHAGTKLFLIGATAQLNNPQTYSNVNCYIGTDNCLYSNGSKVLTQQYSLPLAANGTRGGIQIGYQQSGKNYPVQLSSEKAYVNVPWENTWRPIADSYNVSSPSSETSLSQAGAKDLYMSLGTTISQMSYFNSITWEENGVLKFSGHSVEDVLVNFGHTHDFSEIIGTVSNAQLAHSSITINGTIANLGSSVTISTDDSTKLPLSGGTITGNLTVTGNCDFTNDVVNVSHLYVIQNGYIQMVDKNGSNTTRIGFDANNAFKFYADSRAILFAGGSMKFNNNDIWHAGNDGTGSGLDADLLDGQHGSYYAKASDVPTNTNQLTNGAGFITSSGSCAYATSAGSAGSADSATNADKLDGLSSETFKTRIVSSVTKHTSGWYRVLKCEGSQNHSTAFFLTFFGLYRYTQPTPITFLVSASYGAIAIRQIGANPRYGFIKKVRAVSENGTKFYIDVYFENAAEGTAASTQDVSYEVTPLEPHARDYISVADYSLITDSVTPVAEVECKTAFAVDEAAKLTTARTLWGQSFDGSANVSGAMSGVTNIDALLYFDTTNSRIGIGDRAPVYTLDINGTLNASGNITQNGVGVLTVDGGTLNANKTLTFTRDAASVLQQHTLTINSNGISVDIEPLVMGALGKVFATNGTRLNYGTAANMLAYSNGTVCTNLNADLLDGKHASNFVEITSGAISGISSIDSLLNFDTTNSKIYISGSNTQVSMNGSGLEVAMTLADRTCIEHDGLSYCTYGDMLIKRLKFDDTDSYKLKIETEISGETTSSEIITSDTIGSQSVASAATLTTSRTIWGQSFNGSGNITGNLSDVNHIVPSANTTYSVGSSTKNFEAVFTRQVISYGTSPACHVGTSASSRISLHWSGSADRGLFDYANSTGTWLIATNGTDTRLMFGKVGIGVESPTQKLHVNGKILAERTGSTTSQILLDPVNIEAKLIKGSNSASFHLTSEAVYNTTTGGHHFKQAITCDSSVTATSHPTSSDARLKNFIDDNALIDVLSIANAPAKRFRWKNGGNNKVYCGTIAQYWDVVRPECVERDTNGYLSVQYDILAMMASISIAKKVINHEERIAELERENKELKKKLQELCQ